MAVNSKNLTSGHLLAKGVVWNLVGTSSPIIVALVAIPQLVAGAGLERFGILTIAWTVVGYFSLFDLGLGRALTKQVSERLVSEKTSELGSLIWTATWIMAVLGLAGAFLLAASSPWLISEVLNVSSVLQPETLKAFQVLALSIPIVITTTALRGILEAHQRFDLINYVRIPLGIFTFLGPLLALQFSNSLIPMVIALALGRLMAWCAYLYQCQFLVSNLLKNKTPNFKFVRELLTYGGWMTVTNIVGPLMVYFDRFLIGAMLTMTAVSYYTTPYEVVTKISMIPAALVGVLFPAFSAAMVSDQKRAAYLFERGMVYIFIAVFPLTLVTVIFANDGMTFWMGSDFARHSTFVIQALALGVLLNSLARIPLALIQGAGRPELGALLHLVELPLYILCLWYLIKHYGIQGAAIAWVGRIALDTGALFFLSKLIVPSQQLGFTRALVMLGIGLIVMGMGMTISTFSSKVFFMLLVFSIFIFSTWYFILTAKERHYLGNFARSKFGLQLI